MIVVADASPINYLILIEHIDVLPLLFEHVVLPSAVDRELRHAGSPQPVRLWLKYMPSWCEVLSGEEQEDSELRGLDAGERASIQLAKELHADYVLMDEREGREAATARQLRVVGVLGVLERAEQRGLLNFRVAIQRLNRTNFRMSARLRAAYLSPEPHQS